MSVNPKRGDMLPLRGLKLKIIRFYNNCIPSGLKHASFSG